MSMQPVMVQDNAIAGGPLRPVLRRRARNLSDLALRKASVRLIEQELLRFAAGYGFYSAVYFHIGHALLNGRGGGAEPLRLIASSPVAHRIFSEAPVLAGAAARAAGAHKPFLWVEAASSGSGGAMPASAIVIPVQDHKAGPGMVALLGIDSTRAGETLEQSALHLLATATDIHIRAVEAVRPNLGKAPTAREIECLRMAALGMTAPDTARVLGITSRTVAFHLENIAAKFSASNKVHAVAIGISEGLIRV